MMDTVLEFIRTGGLTPILRSLVIVGIGFLLARLATKLMTGSATERMTPQTRFLLRRILISAIVVFTLIPVLREMGFKLSVLLGAAGILTVAIGFASQTSASNLISGLFLMAEQSFKIGDMIRINELTGEVLSIDLLSVKLRTPDNLYVRVPNESLIKSNVVNISRFPIRRYDLLLKISYREDLEKVKACLNKAAASHPTCLVDPAPLFIVNSFGESGVDVQFSIWAKRESFLEVRNSIARSVLEVFRQESIEIALPQMRIADANPAEAVPTAVPKTTPEAPPEKR